MGMKGGAMESEIQASPTLASFPSLSLTCSAGFPDGERGQCRAPSSALQPLSKSPGPGEITPHPSGTAEAED